MKRTFNIFSLAMTLALIVSSVGMPAISALAAGREAPDTTAPSTTIDSVPSLFTNSDSATFTFSGTDDMSLPENLTFECALDGADWEVCTSPMTYIGLSEGFHSVYIRALDEAGNSDEPGGLYAWTVDMTSPTVTIVSAPVAYTTDTNPAFQFLGTDNVTMTADLAYQCALDGAPYQACSSEVGWMGLGAGYHYLYVYAMDEAGNESTPISYGWIVAAERIQNGGFNSYTGDSKIPTSWVKNAAFAATDGKDKKIKEEGTASVKISGNGSTKTLTQTINLRGNSSNWLVFSFWTKAASVPVAGTCRTELFLYNGTMLKETKTINCLPGTYDFLNTTVNFFGSSTFTKAVIKFTYSKSSGSVWFDAVSLIK
jgi:hypothetical protein